jgi:Lactate racemase N-terminal domain
MTEIPLVRRMRQILDQPVVSDIPGAVREQILGSKLKSKLKPGARVAVAVGSRGIANIKTIALAAIRTLQELGADPFIVAGMGTHGGGTQEGQRNILADFGITAESMGCPVRTEMDVVEIGVNEFGAAVYWDKNAFEADAVVAVNRVKAHTDFRGPIESGIVKMIVIGLGKRESAAQVHRLGCTGMTAMVPASARVVLAKTNFALGLAILENARDETAVLKAVEPDEVFELEPTLLEQAKAMMGRLPFDEADVLLVGEIGKNYSGTGMDPNVIGRRYLENEPDFPSPQITRIAALDISPESHGNSIGVGFADLCTKRLVDAIDPNAVLLNVFTAQLLLRAKVPITLADDRAVLTKALETCWVTPPKAPRLAFIPNTLEVAELYVTETLAPELRLPGGKLEIGDPEPFLWTRDGRIDQPAMFPNAKQARRLKAGDH